MDNRVLIVGAGPTGLVMALWLAKSKVPFRIIDKNSGPGQASRAMAVQARTLEFYRQLGITDQALAGGVVVNVGHLRQGRRILADFPFNDIGSDLSPYPFILSFPQDDHERLLVKCLEDAGSHVEWNTQLVQFKDEGTAVKETLRKGDQDEACEFAYVCGCDGAHSAVRQGLGLGFTGGTYKQIFYVSDVQMEEPFDQKVNACISPSAFCLVFPVRDKGTFHLIVIIPPPIAGKEDVSFEDLLPYVKTQLDISVTKVNWFSRYHVHHRVADHFRQGRVFIAGDAGHIHSPAGGQGMNTGIGDAVNLAWKLASVIRGKASARLLDSYEAERLPFARRLVRTTDRAFEVVVADGELAQRARTELAPRILPAIFRFPSARRFMFQ